uniref:Uncharacterized protein n=1 Tax=Maylandia zebra TaxID=106582 RepID=A0A3P9DIQ6_9CICH
MGLRSGDWLGHSRTFKCFLRSHSFVARAVCFGSLSCWKTQPRFIFKVRTDGRRFWLKISRYMAPFILSLTRISRPVPLVEKQPHSMMFPPPCFTVGMVFLGCNSAFFVLQTRRPVQPSATSAGGPEEPVQPPLASASAAPPGPASASAAPPGPASASAAPPGPASASAAPPGPASASAAPPGPASASAAPPGPASASAAPPGPASASAAPPGPASASAAPPGPASECSAPSAPEVSLLSVPAPSQRHTPTDTTAPPVFSPFSHSELLTVLLGHAGLHIKILFRSNLKLVQLARRRVPLFHDNVFY